MIHNYIPVIHITIGMISIGNTQPAHDEPRISLEGPLKILTFGAYKKPSGNSKGTNTKIDSPCIRYLFLFFIGRANIMF